MANAGELQAHALQCGAGGDRQSSGWSGFPHRALRSAAGLASSSKRGRPGSTQDRTRCSPTNGSCRLFVVVVVNAAFRILSPFRSCCCCGQMGFARGWEDVNFYGTGVCRRKAFSCAAAGGLWSCTQCTLPNHFLAVASRLSLFMSATFNLLAVNFPGDPETHICRPSTALALAPLASG